MGQHVMLKPKSPRMFPRSLEDMALIISKDQLIGQVSVLSCNMNLNGWLIYQGRTVLATHSCPTLCDPTDSSVHGILQARMQEWVAISFSRGSSQPGD